MKTLRIALASAMIVLSLNTFAEMCNPCIADGNLREDSVIFADADMPHDALVNDLLQQMTAAVHQQMVNTTVSATKQHKHGRKKARS